MDLGVLAAAGRSRREAHESDLPHYYVPALLSNYHDLQAVLP
jgi:hypothetical protein